MTEDIVEFKPEPFNVNFTYSGTTIKIALIWSEDVLKLADIFEATLKSHNIECIRTESKDSSGGGL